MTSRGTGSPPSHEQPGPLTRLLVGQADNAIVGTVICAATIAAGAGHTQSLGSLSLAIVGTVTVYWLAHLLTATLARAAAHGHHPLEAARSVARATWPMLAICLIPLAILKVTNLAGATVAGSATVALVASMALLAGYGVLAARQRHLAARAQLLSGLAGALLGVVTIALKALLH